MIKFNNEIDEKEKLNEAILLLKKYKKELYEEEYNKILSSIYNFAIENLYPDEEDIINVVELAKNIRKNKIEKA